MHLLEAQKHLRYGRMAGNAVMIEGPSGLGKSSIVDDDMRVFFHECLAVGQTVGFAKIFLATLTPPDIVGYLFKGERTFTWQDHEGKEQTQTVTVTDPAAPIWYISQPFSVKLPDGSVYFDPGGKPANMYDKFYLFIDEYGQGEPDTKRGVAEVMLKGGNGTAYMPPGSVRVAATNKGSRYGVTKDFDFAIARRSHLAVKGDIEITLRYLNKVYLQNGKAWQTMPVTKAWAETNPQIVFEEEPKEQGPWCNPRSLCDADRFLQIAAADHNGEVPFEDAGMQEALSGIIGVPAMTSFINHFQFRTQLPSYAEVVKDPAATPVPDRPDLAMMMAYELAGWAKRDDIGAVIQYVQRMKRDLAITFVTSLLRRDYNGFIDTAPMQKWVQKNAALLSVISAMT